MLQNISRDLNMVIKEHVQAGKKDVESNDEQIEAFQETWIRSCHRSCLLETRKQRLGIGPRSMALGDVVFVLYGSPMLHVLRPNGTFHRFVGEAYIYDLMDGEALLGMRSRCQKYVWNDRKEQRPGVLICMTSVSYKMPVTNTPATLPIVKGNMRVIIL